MWETTAQCSRHDSEIFEKYLHSLLPGCIGSPLIHLDVRFDGSRCVKGTISFFKAAQETLRLAILTALIRVLAAVPQGYRPVCSEGMEDDDGPFKHHTLAVCSAIETIFILSGGLGNPQYLFCQKSTLHPHECSELSRGIW